jgi:cellulose synthase/poly-beta-1,6-N-acetylglucosamine synthase-like glycosyltransferase
MTVLPSVAPQRDLELACASCGIRRVPLARFCRRCGAPFAAPEDGPTTAIVNAPVDVETGAAVWPDDRAVPPVGQIPVFSTSFAEESEWTATPPGEATAGTWIRSAPKRTSARSPKRCHHRPTRQETCPICGTDSGPRVVVPRMDPAGRLPPELSAVRTLDDRQRRAVMVAAMALGVMVLVAPVFTAVLAIALATVVYVAVVAQRVRIFAMALSHPDVVTIDDDEARAIPDSKLPIYTVLVPAYQEPEVIERLLASLAELEYPRHKLDIKLLLEQDDAETFRAAVAAAPGPHVEIIRVPPSEPRTKPKACVIGLARARGQYVTIYDAEDRPEPLQLRRAIAAFRRRKDLACLQAKLSYHNADQNLITRWFTVEYAMWFGQFLPGLVRQGVPVPLGGTSNHFRRRILEKVGGWDPWNVTEDADLGVRIHRAGHRTGILDSITFEEANSDFVNWVKQRSRWYKGYLQTWLVHMRDPRQLWRDLGARGFIGFSLFVGGTPLIALINPVFWALTAVWFLAAPDIVEALFPAWLYYPSVLCLVIGNFLFLYTSMISARAAGRPGLVFTAALVPIYWVMMSIAAIKAAVQLVHAPSFWEKTAHGLDAPTPVPEAAP